jgi:uncharacterized protein (TIGR02996 family)
MVANLLEPISYPTYATVSLAFLVGVLVLFARAKEMRRTAVNRALLALSHVYRKFRPDDDRDLALAAAEARVTARPAQDAEGLWLAVYAAADDDGPRAVLADWLQERGDPRGEFIALQLAAPRSRDAARRMVTLSRAHGRDWLGRLASVVLPYEVVWERGFPARARFSVKRTSDARRLVGMVELSTLRALRLGALAQVAGDELCARVLLQPSLRRLRELEERPMAMVPALIAARPPFALTGAAMRRRGGGAGRAGVDARIGGCGACGAWLGRSPAPVRVLVRGGVSDRQQTSSTEVD